MISDSGTADSKEAIATLLRKHYPNTPQAIGQSASQILQFVTRMAERDRVIQLAFERGLHTLGTGESAIRLSPPLIISRQQADQAMDVLEDCIRGIAPG